MFLIPFKLLLTRCTSSLSPVLVGPILVRPPRHHWQCGSAVRHSGLQSSGSVRRAGPEYPPVGPGAAAATPATLETRSPSQAPNSPARRPPGPRFPLPAESGNGEFPVSRSRPNRETGFPVPVQRFKFPAKSGKPRRGAPGNGESFLGVWSQLKVQALCARAYEAEGCDSCEPRCHSESVALAAEGLACTLFKST